MTDHEKAIGRARGNWNSMVDADNAIVRDNGNVFALHRDYETAYNLVLADLQEAVSLIRQQRQVHDIVVKRCECKWCVDTGAFIRNFPATKEGKG